MSERAILRELADLRRRVANTIRYGLVTDVDAAAKRVRLQLGVEGKEFKSPWVPYAQVAGERFKIHLVPSVGQQMRLISPAGDFRQGVADPFTWTNALPSPSSDPTIGRLTAEGKDEDGNELGGLRIDISAEGLVVVAGECRLVMREHHISMRWSDGGPGKYLVIDNDLDYGIAHSVDTVWPDPTPEDKDL